MACSPTERTASRDSASGSGSPRIDAPAAASLRAADSVIASYLALSSERDRYDVAALESMRMKNGPCIEEMYGDASSSYWLARGRVLGYEGQVADTLKARLELVTVAEQVPSIRSVNASDVTARIRVDTVIMRLVPDSAKRSWLVCGYLSTGFDFGGYGGDIRYKPPTVTRAQLLRQVDSIRRTGVPSSSR